MQLEETVFAQKEKVLAQKEKAPKKVFAQKEKALAQKETLLGRHDGATNQSH